MNAGDQQGRTELIFLQAVAIPPERRSAFLAQECRDDAKLRQEVESLLANHMSGTIASLLPAREGPHSRRGWTPAPQRILIGFVSRVLGDRWRRTLAWILAALFLVAIGYWTRSQIQQSIRAQVSEQLRVVLNADVTALETWIGGWKREIEVWAASPAMQAYAEKLIKVGGGDPENAPALKASPLQREFTAFLRPLLAGAPSPEDFSVVLLDRTGLRVGATPPYLDRVGRRSSPRAASLMVLVLEGQTLFVPPTRVDAFAVDAPIDPRAMVLVAAPVRDAAGKIIAVLVFAEIAPRDFFQILTVARMGASGETYIVSSEGLMLSPSRFDSMLKKAGLLPDQPAAASELNVEVRDPGGDLTKGYRPTQELEARPRTMILRLADASHHKPADQQTGVILEPYRDYRGIDVVGAWRWLPEHQFAVVTEVDASEAFAPLDSLRTAFEVLFTLLAAFVGMTLLSSVALSRSRRREALLPRLGPYTLLKPIGEGGMGKVYLAQHALLRRPTAVKVLKASDSVSQEAILRFEREVQAASRLTHPNTIEIYDFGRTPDGTFYYAMEYLPGLTLAELVAREGPIGAGRSIHILKQVCGSLREAHEQGLIHRDIKPLNIMLCERGGEYDVVKVLDFGLVRSMDSSTATIGLSAPDRIIGTPLYMAPERFGGQLAADPRSDIYSLGAVAYQLLSGRPAFKAVNHLDLLNQVLHAAPEPLSGASPDLEHLILECLAKDPARRPQSAGDMLEALGRASQEPWTQAQAKDWWARFGPALPVDPVGL